MGVPWSAAAGTRGPGHRCWPLPDEAIRVTDDAILWTSRLALRELVVDDLDFVATMLAHPDVNRYYERRFTRPEAEAWVQGQLLRYAHDGPGLWLVSERASGRPVGQGGLRVPAVE